MSQHVCQTAVSKLLKETWPRQLGIPGKLEWDKEALAGRRRFGPAAPKVPNGSFETLERYMTRQLGILGRLDRPRKVGQGLPQQNQKCQTALSTPLKIHEQAAWKAGVRQGEPGRPKPSRTKSAKRQFRSPLNIHDQVAWKAGVRQGGPSRPKKVGQRNEKCQTARLETLRQHGILGKLEWSKEALAGRRRWGKGLLGLW